MSWLKAHLCGPWLTCTMMSDGPVLCWWACVVVLLSFNFSLCLLSSAKKSPRHRRAKALFKEGNDLTVLFHKNQYNERHNVLQNLLPNTTRESFSRDAMCTMGVKNRFSYSPTLFDLKSSSTEVMNTIEVKQRCHQLPSLFDLERSSTGVMSTRGVKHGCHQSLPLFVFESLSTEVMSNIWVK